MKLHRDLTVLGCVCGLCIAMGCSDQDAERIRNVGAKTLSRAASFADETQSKLKTAIHPLSSSSPSSQPLEAQGR